MGSEPKPTVRIASLRAALGIAAIVTLAHPAVLHCRAFEAGQLEPTSNDGGGDAQDDTSRAPTEIPDADVLDAGDAAPGSFCQARVALAETLFCRDFDAVLSPYSGWSLKVVSANNGMMELYTSPAAPPPSIPNSLRATLVATTNETKTYAYIEERVALAKVAGFRYAFDAFLVDPKWAPGHTNASIASLVFTGDGTPVYELFIVLEKDGVAVGGKLPDYTELTGGSMLPTDRWVHVTLDMSPPKGGNLPIRLTFDSVVALAGSLSYDDGPKFDAVKIGVGLRNFNPPSPTLDIRYDNVELSAD